MIVDCSTLDLIREVCERQGLQCSRLDGSTPADTRMDLVRSFNDGVGKVFLLSTKAGGAGLNLIGANRLILFDPDWYGSSLVRYIVSARLRND